MDAFIDAYYSIDTDLSGSITIDELQRYLRRNNYDESAVKKWLDIFDVDKSGTIEFEEYCEKLGLQPKVVRAKFVSANVSRRLPSSVEVIASDMSSDNQLSIYELVLECHNKHADNKDVVKYLKQRLDKVIGPLFHVVMAKGQFWCWFSQEPGYSFIFKYNGVIYIIWKTPAP